MNAGIFSLVFNKCSGMLVPAAELARTPRRKSGSRRLRRRLAGWFAAIMVAPCALANPIDGVVVSGQASIVSQGSTLTVTNTPGTIINWGSFSINTGELTQFIQQSAASAVLNRVVGQDPSQILGALQSNGRVFIINPNGIVFGAGSQINVAGLVASTLGISDQDFLAGALNFSGTNAGSIQNQGSITATSGGQIYLIAPSIDNTGILTAPNGEILLAAGHSVELVDSINPALRVQITAGEGQATNLGQIVAQGGSIGIFAGIIHQAGSVNADSASVNEVGNIVFKATQRTTLAANSVTSAAGEMGGTIQILGDSINIESVASVDASGVTGGGTISVGQGAINAQEVIVAADATLKADATQSGNGGTVIVWADGTTQFDGQISAQGGAQSGNGGFVETSGSTIHIGAAARVDTRAANGAVGTWLIDPSNFTIAASGGDISGATLSANLGVGNVLIQSSGGADTAGSGDIVVNDSVSWSANNLTLSAAHDIKVNAVMTASGASTLTLNTATANGADAAVAGGMLKMGFNADGSFAGRIDFPGRSGTGILAINGNGYTILSSLGLEGSVTGTDLQGMNGDLTGYYALGTNIDASASATWSAGAGFNPIGSLSIFTGVFDGLGHTVSDLTMHRDTTDLVGLFAQSAGAIRNVGIVNANIVGQNFVGSLVGDLTGAVSHSYATGVVSGGENASFVGGLVGGNFSGTISDSHASVDVTSLGGHNIGGLVGSNYAFATISNSYATGSVNAGTLLGSYNFGGLAGYNGGTIDGSYASGAVNGMSDSSNIGGLVGTNSEGSITNSYASGAVTGAAGQNIGGLVGRHFFGIIDGSYATGAVSGGDGVNFLGGLIGLNVGAATNSFATGSVTGGANADGLGGLVGRNAANGTVSTSYAIGYVSAGADASNLGGLVGRSTGVVLASYWDIAASGQAISAGGSGLTTAQMTQPSSFVGWDFSTTWAAAAGAYPYLLNNYLLGAGDATGGGAPGALAPPSYIPSQLLGIDAINTFSANYGSFNALDLNALLAFAPPGAGGGVANGGALAEDGTYLDFWSPGMDTAGFVRRTRMSCN